MTERCPVPHAQTSTASDAPSAPALRIARHGGLRANIAFLRDTFALLQSVSATGDVILTRILGVPTVVLGHPAPVTELLRDAKGTWIKDRLSQRAADVFGGGLLLSEGETWKRQRRLLTGCGENGRRPIFTQSCVLGGGPRASSARRWEGLEQTLQKDSRLW